MKKTFHKISKANNVSLRKSIELLIKDIELLIIEKEHPSDRTATSYYVVLKKNLKLALIEKVNPKKDDELVVSYYDNNKLCYDSITSDGILPIHLYEKLKDRNNKINKIFRD
jgi:hypothetical protein